MRAGRAALAVGFAAILGCGMLAAQDQPAGPTEATRREAEAAIRGLQQIANQLNDAARLLEMHADAAVIKYDSGHKEVLAADADVAGRTPPARREALRKLVLARMRASRTPGSLSPALADMDRLQELIGEARLRLDAADPLVKRFLVVSVDDLKQGKGFEWRSTHDQLIKVRSLADQAARKAVQVLPLDLPEGESLEDSWDKAFTLLAGGNPVSPGGPPGGASPRGASQGGGSTRPADQAASLPSSFGWERDKRITLVRAAGYRLALTDPALEDSHGRYIFYEEEWSQQRGSNIVRRRWRVAADPATGEQALIKRYPPLTYSGNLEEAYNSLWERDYLWRLEPPENSSEPESAAVESAIASVAQARAELDASVHEFDGVARVALDENDRLAGDQSPPDALLNPELRLKLFAIRAHLAAAPAIVQAEQKVERLNEAVADQVRALEALAAWGNRATLEDSPLRIPAAEWDALQAQADSEIDLAMIAQAQMAASLPPSLLVTLAKFPALEKDVIVHISGQQVAGQGAGAANPAGALRCRQEVWRFVSPQRNVRRVERVVSEIVIDSQTGRQSLLRAGTRYYDAAPDEVLEAVFDRYGGQDIFQSALHR